MGKRSVEVDLIRGFFVKGRKSPFLIIGPIQSGLSHNRHKWLFFKVEKKTFANALYTPKAVCGITP